MKKTLAVLFVACVLVSSVFAFNVKSVGVETGFGKHGGLFLSMDMDVEKDLDVYARLGYTGQFNVSAGVQYKVADIEFSGAKIPFKPGLQLDFNFGKTFVFEVLGTVEFSFSSKPFTAFVRPAFGYSTAAGFAWGVETGVAYLF